MVSRAGVGILITCCAKVANGSLPHLYHICYVRADCAFQSRKSVLDLHLGTIDDYAVTYLKGPALAPHCPTESLGMVAF